tara:strand:- start:266 stop:1402 length:1137 start_codon:yes stop_codon:yes gene_type:complete
MLSRCTRFDLSRVGSIDLFNYIKKISINENGKITDEALKLICKCSEGSVRDALSLLDRALLNSDGGNIDLKIAQTIFGHFDKSLLIKLLDEILLGNEENTLKLYSQIYSAGVEPKTFLNDFLEILYYLKNIASLKLNGTNFDLNDSEYSSLIEISKKVDVNTVLMFWHFTINNMKEIEIVSNQNIAIEMFLIRLIYLSEINTLDKKSENIEKENIYFNNENNLKIQNSITKDKNIVNQIKNTIQTEEESLEEKKKNEINIIKSFEDLIEICKLKKELELKYELETNVNLIKFENKRIDISFNEYLKKDFVKILTTKLFEWTQERWIITLSKKVGGISIKQSSLDEKIKLNKEFIESKEYLNFKKHFSDADLIEIIKKK